MCGSPVPSRGERFCIQQLDERIRVIECPECGLVYKEKIPSEKLLKEIYSEDYVHYSQAANGFDRSAEERVRRMGTPRGRRHLDYGCGGGGLVRSALRLGWDSYGADPFLPSSVSTGTDRAHFMRASAESGALGGWGRFDWISMWAVIEHLDQPLATVKGLSRCLNDGGRIILNAPNADSLVARRRGPVWSIALLLEHTTFWTEKALRYLAARTGMDIVRLRRCGTPYPFGTSIPSYRSFGLRLPYIEECPCSAMQSSPEKGRILSSCVVRVGQRMARMSGIGKLMRLGLNIMRTGDHYYVIFQQK